MAVSIARFAGWTSVTALRAFTPAAATSVKVKGENMNKIISIILISIPIMACNTTRNVSPPPTPVPSEMTESEIEHVLISCLGSPSDQEKVSPGMHLANEILHYRFGGDFIKKRYWNYEGRDEGEVFAGFNNRKYYMRVRMAYDTENVRFYIVDSRNLRQTETSIHKTALRWLGGLESGIRSCLWEYDRLRYENDTLNKRVN